MGVNGYRRSDVGLKPLSSSSYDSGACSPPNPDPRNYQWDKSKIIGKFIIIQLKYIGCTNFEGQKILVYENVSLDDLLRQGSLDPHFSENTSYHSPVARFEPTEKGWKYAELFCSTVQDVC